jgi:hypothetical protein
MGEKVGGVVNPKPERDLIISGTLLKCSLKQVNCKFLVRIISF